MADTLTNPTQSLTDIINILQQQGALTDTYTQPTYAQVNNPALQGVDALAKNLGVNFTYDRSAIEKIYQDATKSALNSEAQSGVEKNYYKHMADAQTTAMDAIRKQYGTAVATGASKGIQAANMLSAALGTSQLASQEATQLAVDKQTLVNKYAQQLKQDSADALKYSNDVATSVGGLAHQLYNDDIQKLTAQLSYNQGINTDAAGYAANKYTAGSNLKGTLASAGAGVYNNNQSSIAAIQAAIEQANATKYAAEKGQNQNINYSGAYSVKQ